MFPQFAHVTFPDNPTKNVSLIAIAFWGFFIVLLFVALLILGYGTVHPVPTRDKPQTTITTEIYTYYTIEYYNGSVDYVHLDPSYEYYATIYCDNVTTDDDDGHICVLSHEHSLQFLDNLYNNRSADYLLKTLVIDLQSTSL